MNQIIALIDVAVGKINAMTEFFYQQKNQEALLEMSGILDAILAVSGAIMPLENIGEEDKKKAVNVLGEAMKAMEEKDYVLLADIMRYDMIDTLEIYKKALI